MLAEAILTGALVIGPVTKPFAIRYDTLGDCIRTLGLVESLDKAIKLYGLPVTIRLSAECSASSAPPSPP